jgi:phosphatidylethanolamine-binding protein (PEBP) family uncharacterized protein
MSSPCRLRPARRSDDRGRTAVRRRRHAVCEWCASPRVSSTGAGLGPIAVVLTLPLVVSACGSSKTPPATSARTSSAIVGTSASRAQSATGTSVRPNFASIGVQSGAISKSRTIEARYTCKGGDVSPPVVWSSVPSGTAEDILVVRSLSRGRITTAWLVGGISPARHHIDAGEVPPEAVVGRNSTGRIGYSLCPPAGKPVLVVIGIYAIPTHLGLRSGFGNDAIARAVLAPDVAWGSTSAVLGPRGSGLR